MLSHSRLMYLDVDHRWIKKVIHKRVGTECKGLVYPVIKPGIMDKLPVELVELICFELTDTRDVVGVMLATGVKVDVKSICLCNDYYVFYKGCKNGHLDLVKWMYERDHKFYDTSMIYDKSFRSACMHGHLDIAKWLYKNFGHLFSEQHINNTFAAVWDLDTLKWLSDTFNILADINLIICKRFSKHPETSIWLYERFKPAITKSLFYGFTRNNNMRSSLNFLKWVHSIHTLTCHNIKKYNLVEVFCDRGDVEGVMWLFYAVKDMPVDMAINSLSRHQKSPKVSKILYHIIGELLNI